MAVTGLGTMVESERMRQLKAASGRRRRAEADERRLAIEAFEAGENQTDVARIIGRSREYLRLMVKRSREQ